MRPSAVELRIEELVLRDLDGVNASYVAVVVQRELARLLAERGVPPGLEEAGAVARVDAGRLTAGAGARADALGAQIAGAVYGALAGGGAP